MSINEHLREAFERELEELRAIFGGNSRQIEIAEEDGPMEWEEAMDKPLNVPIYLEAGGMIEIKINHEEKGHPDFGSFSITK